jgi:hypothetical protein
MPVANMFWTDTTHSRYVRFPPFLPHPASLKISVSVSTFVMKREHSSSKIFSWLIHYATSRKVAGSNPDELIGFFNRPNPSSRTMALMSTQRLTEMSTRNLHEGKGRPALKADNLIV